jgi:hypothetical protein
MAGKTPVDMGFIPMKRMDPRYYDAMEFIESTTQRLSREYAERNKGR